MRGLPLFLLLCLGLVFSSTEATAQEAVPQPLEIGPSGEAYLKTLRLKGVDADVVYYDPRAAMPALETEQEPPPPETDQPWVLTWNKTAVYAVLAAILIGVGFLVYLASGRFTLSLQSEVANPARGTRTGPRGHLAPDGPPADLQAILTMADRRQALVLLAQAALAQTVAANGVLLQPSWTMRDALRHLPTGQAQLDALRSLVLAGERVLFGNRDVTEAEFQGHVAQIRPLMQSAGA